MKDWEYKIALIVYYGPLTIGAILTLCFIIQSLQQSIIQTIQLQTEIQSLRKSIIQTPTGNCND